MDALINQVVTGVPNLAVAIYVIYSNQKALEGYRLQIEKLTDKLVQMVDKNADLQQQIMSTRQDAAH
jgi:cell division protein FtsL